MNPCSIERSDSSQKHLWSCNSPPVSSKQPHKNSSTKNGQYIPISAGCSSGIHIDQKCAYISKLCDFFSKNFWKSIENILNTNPSKFGALTPRSYKVSLGELSNLMCRVPSKTFPPLFPGQPRFGYPLMYICT